MGIEKDRGIIVQWMGKEGNVMNGAVIYSEQKGHPETVCLIRLLDDRMNYQTTETGEFKFVLKRKSSVKQVGYWN